MMLTLLAILATAIGTREAVRYAAKRKRLRRAAVRRAVLESPATCGGCPACRNYGAATVPARVTYPAPVAEPKRDLFWD